MQDFVYFHAPVASVKAINLHDLSSDWINLKEKKQKTKKNIRNRTCSIACGKHMWKKFHKSFFTFHGIFPLCAVNVEKNIPWKPGLN